MIIKESADLVAPNKHQWRTKANRKKAKDLKVLHTEFNNKQKELLKMNIDSKDTMLLTTRNKVLECINLCQEKHGGPLTSIKELYKVLKQFKNDNKSIDRILNLELRLRRLTFTKLKLSCPLFK